MHGASRASQPGSSREVWRRCVHRDAYSVPVGARDNVYQHDLPQPATTLARLQMGPVTGRPYGLYIMHAMLLQRRPLPVP